MAAPANRFTWIDILKGLGILAVITGHVVTGLVAHGMFIFHMPLFFFIGGYLFKVRNDQKSFLKDKAIQLLVPYVVYLLIVYSFQEFVFYTSTPPTPKLLMLSVVRALLGGKWLYSYTTVFWFVPCFFLTQQVINAASHAFKTSQVVFLMVVFLILAYANSYLKPDLQVPYAANVVLMAAPIFFVGFLYKQTAFKIHVLITLFLSIGGIWLLVKGYPNAFYMRDAKYGLPIVTLVSALSIIHVLMVASEYLSRVKGLSDVFIYIGKASMVIMYLHQPIQLLLRDYVTENIWVRIAVSLVIPLLAYFAFEKTRFTRAFLLGSKEDFLFYVHKVRER